MATGEQVAAGSGDWDGHTQTCEALPQQGLPALDAGADGGLPSDSNAETQLRFSFAAAGWLKCFYFGVGKGLQELGLHRGARFAGASAGSLVSTALALDLDCEDIARCAVECSRRVYASPVKAMQLREFLSEVIDRQLPQGSSDLEERVRALDGRVELAVTELPLCRGRRVSRFRSVAHLKRTLLASCCMSPLAGMPFMLDGQLVCDGGLADFQPMLGEGTITCSPFYFSNVDIYPSKPVSAVWGLFPLPPKQLWELYLDGVDDAHRWAHRVAYRAQVPPQSIRSFHAVQAAPRLVHAAEAAADLARPRPLRRKSVAHGGSRAQAPRRREWDEREEHHVAEQVRLRAAARPVSQPPRRSTAQERSALLAFLAFMIARFILPVLVQPLVVLILLAELWVKAVLHLLNAVVLEVVGCTSSARRRGRRSWRRCGLYARSLASPRLFLRALPVVGRLSPWGVNHAKLTTLSKVYRFAVGFV